MTMTGNRFSQTFAVSTAGLRGALSFAEAVVRDAGQGDDVASRVAVVIDETVSNMIVHDASLSESDVFEIALEPRIDGIRLRVADPGHPFDPLSVTLPSKPEIGGHGLRVIRGLASEIRYHREPTRNVLEILVLER